MGVLSAISSIGAIAKVIQFFGRMYQNYRIRIDAKNERYREERKAHDESVAESDRIDDEVADADINDVREELTK